MDISKMMLAVTQRIFSNWTALKLIVESDMGSRDDMQIFSEYVSELLCINDDLIASDVAFELENYVVSKFNTEIDDGSYDQVAEELLRLYNIAKNNNEVLFQQELEKTAALQSWLVTPQQRIHRVVEAPSSDEEADNKEPMEVDEWVTVKSKRKSNK